MAFNEHKAAQAAAYLLNKCGGSMSHLKLIKLLYLTDRESLDQYGEPMTWDRFVSMPHGPVPSVTLNLLNGDAQSSDGGWSAWVGPRHNHEVHTLKPTASREAFDALSDVDIELLEAVWARFGHMDKYALRDWTHENCAEWQDPNGSSLLIHNKKLFEALGWSSEDAVHQQAELHRRGIVKRSLDQLR